MQRCAWCLLALLLVPLPAAAADPLPLAQRLDQLERRVKQVSELTLQLDELRRENRLLRGEIEQLGHALQQLERKQRDIYLDIDQRLSAAESGGTAAAAPAPTAPAPQPGAVEARAAAAPVAAVDRRQIEAEYQAAYALLSPQQKRFDEAAVALRRFLERYPDDELAPNAQYWLGEAYYVSQKNAEAQSAFEAVVNRYPGSAKASDALFKIGRLQQAEGKRDAARASYGKVVQDYPDSPAAGLARQRLEQMGR